MLAIVIKKYLPLSETFIYEQIRNLRVVKPVILTEKRENLDLFPHEPIFSLDSLPRFRIFIEDFQRGVGIRSKYFEKVLSQNKVKLVHAHFGFMGIYVLPLCKKLGIPLITHFHGFDVSRLLKEPFYLRRLRSLFTQGDLFIVVSRSMKKDVERLGCPSEKIVIHYGGVDLNKFKFRARELPSGKIKILMCGRLTKGKGFHYGIEVFKKVYKKHRNIELKIIGEGNQRKRLERMIKEANLSRSITLLGAQPHPKVIREMEGSHLFMLPCLTIKGGDREGVPNVLKEAQASGMPVLSTYHGGIPEVVEEGKSGFLVKEKDREVLIQKLSFLIENPRLWPKFGGEGRKIVEEKFDISKQIGELEQIYSKFLPPLINHKQGKII
jgi:glycosyltransferase involved in cell wall biosynthesis